ILDMIAKIASDQLRLEQLKPLQTQHRFTTTPDDQNGGQKVISQAYNNKVRKGRVSADIRIDVRARDGAYVQHGTIGGVRRGKIATLNTNQPLDDKVIMTLTSIGRDDPTTAEARRDATVLRILQGDEKLMSDSPWIQNIWFPADDGQLKWPKNWAKPIKPLSSPPQAASSKGKPNSQLHSLNASQQDAVNTMLSALNKHCLTLVQGPPGSGKTSVISTYVNFAIAMGHKGIWLVAKSNVAVKNIAEKLLSIGFHDWRLLVSQDFYLGWHEHLYTELKNNLIRSDKFFSISPEALGDCQVVLCTLSMLSNGNINKFTSHIPLNTLIVDEASQIEIGDYISVFSRFKTLRKACFIGDDKQLPPYGQEDLQDLQSIFEVSHLHEQAIFLDTQYRMPPQIGLFISGAVYEEKLNSNPFHPITDKFTACLFIDIMDKEKRHGESYMVCVFFSNNHLHLLIFIFILEFCRG
ncbi:P-loop containing nucleoside triphosphate hydrolase protein, partial [Crucibulum laeve]